MSHRLFEFIDNDEWDALRKLLTERQRLLVVSAIRYHSLINPGRELRYEVSLGRDDQYPRLTDASTLDGAIAADAEMIGAVAARSLVLSGSVRVGHFMFGNELAPDPVSRSILVTPDEATDADVRARWRLAPRQRVYNYLEGRAPAALDIIRELTTQRRERRLDTHIDPRKVLSASEEAAAQSIRYPVHEIAPGAAAPDAPRAVLVGMHWLQTGGAERWAIETVAMVKSLGMVPIVITDHDSHSPWITRPELEGSIVLPLTFPTQQRVGDEVLLRALAENFDLRGVLVHHSQWLYDRLPWIKRYRPEVPVIDSLHIVEYSGGGFPAAAVHEDAYIDIHHVISPQLRDWLVRVHHVRSTKVVLAPLLGLTTADAQGGVRARRPNTPFTIAFVGRLARQKRPDSFLMLAHALFKSGPDSYRFILHGDGELDRVTEALIKRYGLGDVLEWRRSDTPVEATFADADLLVITSRNEGITLTTLEAVAAGVPVLSTDVGSQKSVIPPVALLPRNTSLLLRRAIVIIPRLANDEPAREKIWQLEAELIYSLTSLPTASAWMKDEISKWV